MMKRLLALIYVLAVFGLSLPAQPVHQQDIFVAGEGGYHTYRIPAVVRALDGTLLAFCEGRKHGPSDTGDIDLILKRSVDGGKTWGDLQVVWDDGDNTCGNPCPVVDQTTGIIWLWGTHNLGTDREHDIITGQARGTRTPWLMHSRDHGLTWSEARPMADQVKDPAWGWYATGPGIGIQVQAGPHEGRLVVPCVHSYDDPAGNLRGGPYEYGSHVIYSDDQGDTWQLGGVVRPKVNECQVVELAHRPGALLLNMRSYFEQHCRAEAVSWDGGITWSGPVNQPALPEPRAQASMLRQRWSDAAGAGVLLFANPADPRERRRMTVRISRDDGVTWPQAVTLHEEFSAYSALVSLGPDQVGVLYERGFSLRPRSYERITWAVLAIPPAAP
jgi:sialidase-1